MSSTMYQQEVVMVVLASPLEEFTVDVSEAVFSPEWNGSHECLDIIMM